MAGLRVGQHHAWPRQPELVDVLAGGCREHEVFQGRLETWLAAETLRDLEPTRTPPMDARRMGWESTGC